MALARTQSVVLEGIRGHVVEVETHLGAGLPNVRLVGLPDASLNEARDRCRAALINSGHPWPNRRVTIGLSPASLPKAGSHFDLAIALGVLAAEALVPPESLLGCVVIGELALDGRLRAVPGVLPATLAAAAAGFRQAAAAERVMRATMRLRSARPSAAAERVMRATVRRQSAPVRPRSA